MSMETKISIPLADPKNRLLMTGKREVVGRYPWRSDHSVLLSQQTLCLIVQWAADLCRADVKSVTF